MKKKVIVDCDNTMGRPFSEIDDGLTILYLLGREDIDLLGITNCYGNASLREVEYWTDRFLHDIDRADIPRLSGKPYSGQNSTEWFKATWGKHFIDEKPNFEGTSEAAHFLVEQVSKYPGEIHLLALGSMTNLFEAFIVDPTFFSKLNEIALMGGVLGDFAVDGRPCAELNLACNPAGAHGVLNNGCCPVVVMNAHICLQAPFLGGDMDRISYWPERRRQMVREWIGVFGGKFYLWDLLPAVYLSYPDLFDLKKAMISSTIEDLNIGLLKRTDGGAEVIMPDEILDVEGFQNAVHSAWATEWGKESQGWR
ncbi:MAG: nucleoside hydrolase [Rectinemataceae bacterium]|jgi:inosine-uridine nucleoside N-ribohydrolase